MYIYIYLFIIIIFLFSQTTKTFKKSYKFTLKFSGSDVMLERMGIPPIIAYSTPINNNILIQIKPNNELQI